MRATPPPMIVEVPRPSPRAGEPSIARVTMAGDTHQIEFACDDLPMTLSGDALLATSLLPAMSLGASLRIGAAMSPKLAASSADIQRILAGWWRDLEVVDVQPESIEEAPRPDTTRGVACFFSGGVDSFYSVLDHLDEIEALVFVHGFDLWRGQAAAGAGVLTRLRQASAELGLPLLEIRTNIRRFSESYVKWKVSHGSVLAAVGHCLRDRFRKVYVAATYGDSELHPWGTHPELDPLWSSESLEVAHDAHELTRFQKVSRLAESELAMRWLLVCNDSTDGANCGRCKKCLRTMVALRVVGGLERCPTLPDEIDLDAIARSEVAAPWFSRENLRQAEAHGEREIARAIRASIRRSARRKRKFAAASAVTGAPGIRSVWGRIARRSERARRVERWALWMNNDLASNRVPDR